MWEKFDEFFRIKHPCITYTITISLSMLALLASIVALVLR